MASMTRTQRRNRLKRKAVQGAKVVQQFYAALPPTKEEPVLGAGVLPCRHRKNYDTAGRIIFGPRPAELAAQRRAFIAGGQAA